MQVFIRLIQVHLVAFSIFSVQSFVAFENRLILSATKRLIAKHKTLLHSSTAQSAEDSQKVELFNALAQCYCSYSSAELGLKGNVRGLIARKDIVANEKIISIPGEVCLWSDRNGAVRGLKGQTEFGWQEAGDLRMPVSEERQKVAGLTWDVRLALALHEATADPSVGGQLWDFYGRLLPQPHDMTVPLCMPIEILVEMQNERIAAGAQAQKLRLTKLFPKLMKDHSSHRATAFYSQFGDEIALAMPFALQWTFGLVRSRAFVADHSNMAFVPFLDMANHSFRPNSNFTYDGGDNSFNLFALKPISAGDEILISYGQSLSNDRLAVQYGFILETNPNPSAITSNQPSRQGMLTVDVEKLAAVLRSSAEDVLGSSEDFKSSIKLDVTNLCDQMVDEILTADATIIDSVRKYKAAMGDYAAVEYSTTLREDSAFLNDLMSSNKIETIDERLMFALKYRIHRKCVHTFCTETVERALSSLTR